MRPLYNAPSWGSIGASQSWFLVVAFTLYSPAATVPLLMWICFAVSLRAVWSKRPAFLWRTFAFLSILGGLVLGCFLKPEDHGINYDGFLVSPLLVWTIYTGIALVPLAIVSSLHTVCIRCQKSGRGRQG